MTKNFFYLAAVGAALLTSSCNSGNQKKEYIVFESIGETNVDTTHYEGALVLGKGATEKMWDKIYKECMKTDAWKDAYYFGPTNTISLGSITDKKHESIIRTIDTTVFTPAEINRMIKPGVPATCDYFQELNMDINALINSEISISTPGSSDINAELKTAITNDKKTAVRIDGWQKDELLTGVLSDILNETTDPRKLKYKKDLLAESNLILVRVAKINGFTSKITTSTNISAGLEAKLREGVIAKVGNTGAEAKFEYENRTTILVTCKNEFYVYGQYMKAKKVNVKPTS
ncbi:hypothetical protein [Sphingobacterium multivorum]|uniref:hypothetical protein n=1 Tax=Sphingobacterium multivorum TaxID=28454 RepID=UPI003DA582B0